MKDICTEQQLDQILRSYQDAEYQKFQSLLIPEIDSDSMLGVRTPVLRKISARMDDAPKADLLEAEAMDSFEKIQLRAFCIEQIKDYQCCVRQLNLFLPLVNNWASCDQCSPKALIQEEGLLHEQCLEWMQSDHPYTIRYGILTLMRHYLKERFDPNDFQTVASHPCTAYPVRMMKAWYFATAMVYQREAVLALLESRILDPWVQNKTIQKARESRRISQSDKELLLSLKIQSKPA